MSEYWKSTPRYWCQHCKTFIRDTAYERNQHEATGKHQASLKRFLRDIHRDKEKKERENQRAKSEVERLKGLVSGSETPGQDKQPPWKQQQQQQRGGTTSEKAPDVSRGAAAEERKRQMAQLADMGVAVPDQYRPEMALMGEWREVKEDEPAKEPTDTVAANAIGVRKRKQRPDDRDENESGTRKAWGSAIRSHPGEDDQELDALLAMTSELKGKKGVKIEEVKSEVKTESDDAVIKTEEDQVSVKKEEPDADLGALHTENGPAEVKQEPGDDEEVKLDQGTAETTADASVDAPAVVFKKRKTKQTKR